MSRLNRTFWPTLGLLIGLIALFELTSLDLWVQDHLFDFGSMSWLVDKAAPGPRFYFYDSPKLLLIGFGLGLIGLVVGPAHWRRGLDRRALVVVICTMASVPAVVGWAKATTNVFCPSEIDRYGGDVRYVRLCERYPAADRPLRKGRCFPAGHASGGFALLSLAGLARTQRGRGVGVTVGLIVGGVMGSYQMAKGAHFLSHTLVTALTAWWLFLLWHRMLPGKDGRRPHEQSSDQRP